MTFNCPLNSVSFGQVSVALLREAYKKEKDVLVALIGDRPDLKSQGADNEFQKWIEGALNNFTEQHDRKNPTLKLWHLNGSFGWMSDNQTLMTFHELDNLTKSEANIAKNQQKLIVTSKFSQDLFKSEGVDAHLVPLGFDAFNFKTLDKDFYSDDRVVFNLGGKFEFRKHHAKILKAWTKKYGNNKKYFLQCAVFNPFLDGQRNNAMIANALGHEKYFNMTFLPNMDKNSMYNDFLNSGHIVLGMSGGEGWGLPEFQSVAMGKHAVILNAHAYQEWANEDNAVMVGPSGKIECIDDIFFKKGLQYNQGSIFDWDEDDFISACEEAVKRVNDDKVNHEGLKLQDKFSYSKTFDEIQKVVDL